ncbi:MAG: cobalt-precorrin-7 (C(5))-methyltransferase, partial [Pseudonocardiales bacterium]|nr:cobalt-precorrin-7 (C(5))-methyltransferase [Pseudonocardiales bacterium]
MTTGTTGTGGTTGTADLTPQTGDRRPASAVASRTSGTVRGDAEACEVTVVGVDGPLSLEARAVLARAELVIGAARLLPLVSGDVERLVLGAIGPALERIRGRRAVVLAGGDPGFFGIVRVLREHGYQPVVLPALSSVQRLFARVGRSWDDVAVVSTHGRALGPA